MRKKGKAKKWLWALAAGLVLKSLIVMWLVAGVKLSQRKLLSQERKISMVSEYGFVDVRGQMHAHSYISHDSKGSLEEIAAAAKKSGAVWVILTDHYAKDFPDLNYAMEKQGTLLIFGKEISWNSQGSHLRVFLEESGAGLDAYGHIEKFSDWPGHYWDAVEILNFHSNLMAPGRNLKILKNLLLRPFNFYPNFLNNIPPANLDFWQGLCQRVGKPIPIFVAPDAHQNLRVLGLQLDPYEVMFRLASTHVLVEDSRKSDSDYEELEIGAEEILQAIKKGRTYAAFDYLGDSTGFQFWIEGNKKKFFLGDTAVQADKLVVKNPETVWTEIRIFYNNQLVARKEWVSEWVMQNPVPGFWRVEIWRDGQLWIMSSQILTER